MDIRKHAPPIIAALLILLFVYTATSKLLDHQKFYAVLSITQGINKYASIVSWLLPLTEIAISILLFIPAWRKYGFLFSTLIMAIFTSYIGAMLLFASKLPCSCGGVLSNLTWTEHLLFNFFFTAIAIAGYHLEKNKERFIAINRISRTPV